MAMYDEKWKQAEAARIAKNRAGAASAASAAGDWALGRSGGTTPAKPMFSAPDYSKPNPTNAPVMTANLPAPKPAVATPPARPGSSAAVAKQAPSQAMTLDQANAREVNARTAMPPPTSTTQGAGAPSSAGAVAAPQRLDPNTYTNSAGVTKRVPMPGTMDATSTTVGSVNRQNFGNPVVPQAQASIARPGVASTYGLSVNDPRIDDQRAIARPQLGPNQTAGGGTLRGPDAMAEQYNSREDRELVRKLIGDADSARFRQELVQAHGGRAGRAATAALGDIAGQQAQLAAALSGQSSGAVQGRANRDNQFGIADLSNAGETERAGITTAAQRDIAGMQDATKRFEIARPQTTMERAEDGSLIQVTGTIANPVLGPDGKPVKGQPQGNANTGQITPALQLEAINKELAALAGNPPMGDDPAYTQRVQQLREQQSAFLGGGQQPQAQAPQVGTVKNGYRFKGGNPADQKNWEKAQ